MVNIEYKREPIVFQDSDSMRRVLDDRIPLIAEDNCFKLCNFCGPSRTHADGCMAAVEMFASQNPEFSRMDKPNRWLNAFRTGAVFTNFGRKSAVLFLSTISEKEVSGVFADAYEEFVKRCSE